jgi:LacI family transcriptional regulator
VARKSARRSGKVVTIHDVARHAGVSPMTVSRVMNSEPNVREETRARVMASVKALRYSPNLAARSLASANGMHIGIFFRNPSAGYLSELLLGSLDQSRRSGCQLVIEQCDSPEKDREAIQRLVKGGIDGVVLPAPLCDSEEALRGVAEAGIPAVLVSSGRTPPEHSAVHINNFEASRAMTRHLLGLGHQNIGFINGHPAQASSGQRFRGFIEAMTEAGLKVGPHQVAQGYFDYRSGLTAAEQLLKNFTPTAIFASNDDMALATMAIAHRRGLDVPGDLAIVGFDDTPLATTVWPELTTIRQPIADMAREAVRLLVDQIRGRRAGDPPPVIHKLLKFTLVERQSSAAVSARSTPRRKRKAK